jgi:hypothetical protein
MRLTKNPAFENPLYYLTVYSFAEREWTVWLIKNGALQDWQDRPVAAADFGDDESRRLALKAFPRLAISDKQVLR